MAPKQFGELLCHKHRDKVTSGGPAPPEEKAFCFAKGLGKVYETGVTQHEFLTVATIPGCPGIR